MPLREHPFVIWLFYCILLLFWWMWYSHKPYSVVCTIQIFLQFNRDYKFCWMANLQKSDNQMATFRVPLTFIGFDEPCRLFLTFYCIFCILFWQFLFYIFCIISCESFAVKDKFSLQLLHQSQTSRMQRLVFWGWKRMMKVSTDVPFHYAPS